MAKLTEEQKQQRKETREYNKRIREEEQARVRAIERRAFDIKSVRERFLPQPTRFFEVGEVIEYGNHDNATIVKVFDEGMFYEVTSEQLKGDTHFIPWCSLFKFHKNNKERLFNVNQFGINFINSVIGGLLHKVYDFGVDFDPVYQRGYVWSETQKLNLIDAIMDDRDIGKFIFSSLPFESGKPSYRIIDGKQRLSTICEFFEDRLKWKGKYFSELSIMDRYHFREKSLSCAEIGEVSIEREMEIFLSVNENGTPIPTEHLDKVKQMLKNKD
jgi:hypothetical protein